MDQIRRLAFISVARGCGFAALAIFTMMIGVSFDLLLMAQAGAVLLAFSATVLQLRAVTAPSRNAKRTEVWIMLDPKDAPPPAIAQQVIGGVLAETYGAFARWALTGGVAMWAMSAVLRLAGH